MRIYGLVKTTLLDYPEHLASTLFLGGCNFLCPFCHNASLVLHPNKLPSMEEDEVLTYLSGRKHILEGVCITGGEPTLHKELPLFIEKIKQLGLKVKLDTNGYNPHVLRDLINRHLIDYVAIDIKNSKEKYAQTVGLKQFDTDKISESIQILKSGNLPYEFRTTVIKEFHTEDDFHKIGQWLQGSEAYYLQAFKASDNQIQPGFSTYSYEELQYFKDLLHAYLDNVIIRGLND